MGRILALLALAASLLAATSSEASAWVCFATGIGPCGWGRSYSVIDAKLWALRQANATASCRSARSSGVVRVGDRGRSA
jgi:hypothetical protein